MPAQTSRAFRFIFRFCPNVGSGCTRLLGTIGVAFWAAEKGWDQACCWAHQAPSHVNGLLLSLGLDLVTLKPRKQGVLHLYALRYKLTSTELHERMEMLSYISKRLS